MRNHAHTFARLAFSDDVEPCFGHTQWSDALSVSATIEADYRVVQQYLTHGKLIGSTMCIIALLSWYMTLGKEISDCALRRTAPHSYANIVEL